MPCFILLTWNAVAAFSALCVAKVFHVSINTDKTLFQTTALRRANITSMFSSAHDTLCHSSLILIRCTRPIYM